MKTLGFTLCVRNCIETDYCWEESLNSVLPIADQVVVCDSESTDGTRERLEEIASSEKKIKIVDWKWQNPKGDHYFIVNWYNHARKQLDTDLNFQIEADEVLSERSFNELRSIMALNEPISRRVLRYNFWQDHRHMAPNGHVCSHDVIRLGDSGLFMPSDFPMPEAIPICNLSQTSNIEVFHYGFIRKRKGFFIKARRLQNELLGSYDPRLAALEDEGENDNWMTHFQFPEPLREYFGPHPKSAHKWLEDRGYKL
jgi:glycosyltransferase involved in cell wall biosynthesis